MGEPDPCREPLPRESRYVSWQIVGAEAQESGRIMGYQDVSRLSEIFADKVWSGARVYLEFIEFREFSVVIS